MVRESDKVSFFSLRNRIICPFYPEISDIQVSSLVGPDGTKQDLLKGNGIKLGTAGQKYCSK
jgi:hypothetical protein